MKKKIKKKAQEKKVEANFEKTSLFMFLSINCITEDDIIKK
jgi:hypothetical protein